MLVLNKLMIFSLILLTIGGLNWGTVGLLNIDLVALIFGHMSTISRVIYGLVGLSAIYIIWSVTLGKKISVST